VAGAELHDAAERIRLGIEFSFALFAAGVADGDTECTPSHGM